MFRCENTPQLYSIVRANSKGFLHSAKRAEYKSQASAKRVAPDSDKQKQALHSLRSSYYVIRKWFPSVALTGRLHSSLRASTPDVYNRVMELKDPFATSGLPNLSEEQLSRPAKPAEAKFLILVVEDSPDNLAVISLALQQQGYRVVTANNGEDAVTVAHTTLT